MAGIRKSFPGVKALDGVDLEVLHGEVHVLLGENGAGKSTLMKVLSGAHERDDGRIWIDGQEVGIASPGEARALGIAIIYQELTLVPQLSAAENIFLGREPTRALGIVDRVAMQHRADILLAELGATFSRSISIGHLSIAERQLVEIAKALSLDARILVMDEPTSALTERETAALFAVIRRLTHKGVAIVYISHRMDEIFEIGDRVTVLRDGRHVATREVRSAERRELVRLMADRELDEHVPKTSAQRGDEILRVEHLNRRGVLHDVCLSVHSGEILGIAGLLGAGRTEIARAIFGLDARDSGELYVRGVRRRIRSPRDAIRARIGFVTEDRKREGLVLGRSVRENIALPVLRLLQRAGFVRRDAERALSTNLVRDLRIHTPSVEQLAVHLSGGNQQKIVLAKWIASNADILILDEPTRGIDVGAKQEIYILLGLLATKGVAIILISSELAEIVGLSDRVLVMRRGRIASEFTREEATQERILASAVGA